MPAPEMNFWRQLTGSRQGYKWTRKQGNKETRARTFRRDLQLSLVYLSTYLLVYLPQVPDPVVRGRDEQR